MTLDDLEGQNQGHEKKIEFFLFQKSDFLAFGRYYGCLHLIEISGRSVHQDPQQRTKHGHFLLTSEVHISETVADRHIVTINHI